MSLSIGAAVPAIRLPAGPSGGGDIVALAVAARASAVSAPLLGTLQRTDAALASAAGSVGTDITA